MALSLDAVSRLCSALGKQDSGNELASAVNLGVAQAAQDVGCIPAIIVATSISATVDFAALAVGDKVIHIPATAGSAQFTVVATAGTLPVAAVVGDLYVVLRAFVAPSPSNFQF